MHITIKDLSTWIKENTSLSDTSIYKYTRAVNTISTQMLELKVIPVGLFELSELQLDVFIPQILNNEFFKEKNKRGNNMYSNALKQYRLYRAANEGLFSDVDEMKNVIPNYDLLKETERLEIVKSRIGQGQFRDKLMAKYNKCIITGLSSERLLIASHIKPWAVSNNEERLSEENGLLLSPTFDKLFDCGLISFSNTGKMLVSSWLAQDDLSILNIDRNRIYDLKSSIIQNQNMEYHRDVIFVK